MKSLFQIATILAVAVLFSGCPKDHNGSKSEQIIMDSFYIVHDDMVMLNSTSLGSLCEIPKECFCSRGKSLRKQQISEHNSILIVKDLKKNASYVLRAGRNKYKITGVTKLVLKTNDGSKIPTNKIDVFECTTP